MNTQNHAECWNDYDERGNAWWNDNGAICNSPAVHS